MAKQKKEKQKNTGKRGDDEKKGGVWQRLNATPHQAFAVRLVLVVAGVFFASYTHLLNVVGIDTWLERLQLEQMDYSISSKTAKDLRLLYIDETDKLKDAEAGFEDEAARQLWRGEYARLLTTVGDVPRLVTFDLTFPNTNSDDATRQADEAFGNSVRDARAPVIIGAELNDQGAPELTDSLKTAQWGLAAIGGFRLEHGQGKAAIRKYALARSTLPASSTIGSVPAIASLAVKMLQLLNPAHMNAALQIDTDSKEVVLLSGTTVLKRISCDLELEESASPHWIATMPLHYPRVSQFKEEKFQQVLKRLPALANEYRSRVLLIGARLNKEATPGEQGEKVMLSADQNAYGYQVHASVFSDLLEDVYPRRLGNFWIMLVLFVLGILAGLGRARLPNAQIEVDTKIIGTRNLPLGLLILLVFYACVAWLFYRSSFILFDVGYGILVIVASYYICGSVLAKDPKVSRKGG